MANRISLTSLILLLFQTSLAWNLHGETVRIRTSDDPSPAERMAIVTYASDNIQERSARALAASAASLAVAAALLLPGLRLLLPLPAAQRAAAALALIAVPSFGLGMTFPLAMRDLGGSPGGRAWANRPGCCTSPTPTPTASGARPSGTALFYLQKTEKGVGFRRDSFPYNLPSCQGGDMRGGLFCRI